MYSHIAVVMLHCNVPYYVLDYNPLQYVFDCQYVLYCPVCCLLLACETIALWDHITDCA